MFETGSSRIRSRGTNLCSSRSRICVAVYPFCVFSCFSRPLNLTRWVLYFLFLENEHAQIPSLLDTGHLLLCITLHNLVHHTEHVIYDYYHYYRFRSETVSWERTLLPSSGSWDLNGPRSDQPEVRGLTFCVYVTEYTHFQLLASVGTPHWTLLTGNLSVQISQRCFWHNWPNTLYRTCELGELWSALTFNNNDALTLIYD